MMYWVSNLTCCSKSISAFTKRDIHFFYLPSAHIAKNNKAAFILAVFYYSLAKFFAKALNAERLNLWLSQNCAQIKISVCIYSYNDLK